MSASAKLDQAIPDGMAESSWLRQRIGPLLGLASDPSTLEQNFVAWQRFLEMKSGGAPTVLVFEDLHWAEETLLAFLEHAVAFSHDVPMLFVVTTRPELLEHYPQWGTGARNSLRMSLEPLSDEEVDEILSRLLGGRLISPELRRSLLTKVGGNPLFAEEFVRWLRHEGRDDNGSRSRLDD